MATLRLDPEILAHLEWIGFVRPTGLVVSAPALVRAGAILDRRDVEGLRLLRAAVEERTFPGEPEPAPWLADFHAFATSVLGWSFSPKGYAGTPESPIPPELELPLPEYGETLRPDFAVRELDPQPGRPGWQLLVSVVEPGLDLDRVAHGIGRFEASEHGRMERLLRQTGVPAGLLSNGRVLRLLSAPYGESSGWIDFRVADMALTAGRPICTALRLLLNEPRLLSLPRSQRLAALLESSRKFQNEVSERLAEQVLHALYELLRGFQAAHDASGGRLLREPLAEHPDEVYRALLTVILRLVFLLYAEERDMLPEDETFLRSYSLAGLYDRLREDAALFPDTMDERFGSWAQLLVLFRMVFDGADWGAAHLPKRHGVLFDPERFKFLEGRPAAGARQVGERIEPPRVPDGTIYRALEKLLVLNGQRISYRALDVEQIGSVYETMIGFRLETAKGRSVAIKPQKKQGVPTVVDLEALLVEAPAKREKWLEECTGRSFSDGLKRGLKAAATPEDLHAVLEPVIDLEATPDLVPRGAMVLQPSEERRRSGSHYTPRSLTEPIVRTTLEPVLARLREAENLSPTPEQILALKVCDPAMGSGAFLVEACRQLGDALIDAWKAHGGKPAIPPDEDEVIFARRLIAQRCLYGVDKNPMAVDLSKVSLWLATLAKDHALTFVDHALRHGDSLVGLSRRQVEAFHWDGAAPTFQAGLETMQVREQAVKVSELRRQIREADDSVPDWVLRDLWDRTQFELGKVRLIGDLVLAAFFEGEKPRDRERKRSEYAKVIVSGKAESYRSWLEEWRQAAERPLVPFHWEIEFSEVFDRENPGFDAIVGNPPFTGGKIIPGVLGPTYCDLIKTLTTESKGAADLVAYFFRRSFVILSDNGCLGLLATNSLAQTVSRRVGLEPILRTGGRIYEVWRDLPWPGEAAVVVTRIHILKGEPTRCILDGRSVENIPATLSPGIDISTGRKLHHRIPYASGVVLYGDSFILEPSQVADFLPRNPGLGTWLRKYVNGKVLNETPSAESELMVVDFGETPLSIIQGCDDFLQWLMPRILAERANQTRQVHETRPWLHWDKRTTFFSAARKNRQVLVCATPSTYLAFRLVDSKKFFMQDIVVFAEERLGFFALMQSQVHQTWAYATAGTLKKDIRYSTSNTFVTFPFADDIIDVPEVSFAGAQYHATRDAFMEALKIGLTSTYSRFHSPDERAPEILKLRELHAVMDRAVLDAYGWTDIPTDCEFFLDYGIDEEDWGKKKKPYRYRWPNDVRDEVLARLLELNAQRAQEETRSGASAARPRRGRKAAAKAAAETSETRNLFS